MENCIKHQSCIFTTPNEQYPTDEIQTLMFDVIFHFKFNNVQILNQNLDML
jgi:hypothetical protein